MIYYFTRVLLGCFRYARSQWNRQERDSGSENYPKAITNISAIILSCGCGAFCSITLELNDTMLRILNEFNADIRWYLWTTNWLNSCDFPDDFTKKHCVPRQPKNLLEKSTLAIHRLTRLQLLYRMRQQLTEVYNINSISSSYVSNT